MNLIMTPRELQDGKTNKDDCSIPELQNNPNFISTNLSQSGIPTRTKSRAVFVKPDGSCNYDDFEDDTQNKKNLTKIPKLNDSENKICKETQTSCLKNDACCQASCTEISEKISDHLIKEILKNDVMKYHDKIKNVIYGDSYIKNPLMNLKKGDGSIDDLQENSTVKKINSIRDLINLSVIDNKLYLKNLESDKLKIDKYKNVENNEYDEKEIELVKVVTEGLFIKIFYFTCLLVFTYIILQKFDVNGTTSYKKFKSFLITLNLIKEEPPKTIIDDIPKIVMIKNYINHVWDTMKEIIFGNF